MPSKKLNKLLKEKKSIEERVYDEIFKEIEEIAKARNFDKVLLTPYEWVYKRGGREVSCKPIDDLLDLFIEEIHAGGIQGVWEKGKGWT